MKKRTVQWWFKKFCKGDESLEDEGCSGQPLEVDNNQLRGSLKLILIQLHTHSFNTKDHINKIQFRFAFFNKLRIKGNA